jgi:hypothetical protein
LIFAKKSIRQGGPTVHRFSSIFSQLLQLFPRLEFEQAVKKHRSDYSAKGFTSWGQFVAMLFCQFGRAHSLREICGGLASCEGKLKHLGVSDSPKRSTLAYANANRPWSLYQTVFEQLLAKCQLAAAGRGTRKKFRFKNKLVSLDSSVIDLSLSLFDWAQFRRTKGAIKLHMLLDHDGYLPSFAVVTNGKTSDIKVARRLRFERGTVVVMDRGYIDYEWFVQLTIQGVYFVTRVKDNALFEIVENRPVPPGTNIRNDQIIFLPQASRARPRPLFQNCRDLGRGKAEIFHFPYQPPQVRANYDCGNLQGPLASGAVLQGDQAESEDQDFPRDKLECGQDTDLDGTHRNIGLALPAADVHVRVVVVEFGGTAEASVVRLSGPVWVAEHALRRSAAARRCGQSPVVAGD